MDRVAMAGTQPTGAMAPAGGMLLPVVLLLALHPLASTLFLPGLPALRLRLAASDQAVQWTLSAFFFGFGATQLLWGALADRWGRRPTLLLGLLAYAAAAIGGLLASDIQHMVAWRGLQGAGVAAAGVCARAMLRDLYRPDDCARMLSLGFSWTGLLALAAPLGGAMLLGGGGVVALLAVLAALGVAVLAYVAVAVPETRPALPSGGATLSLLAGWRIAAHPVFRAYTALTVCTYTGHYLYLVGSPGLLIERYGMSVFGYGLALSAGSALHLAGTVACRYWLAGRGVRHAVACAGALSLASGLLLVGLAAAGVRAPWAVLAPQAIYIFAHAVHQSCGQAAAMAPFRDAAGTATALQGTVLPLVAVAVAALLARPLAQSPLALPLGLGVCALLTATVAWTAVQRAGRACPLGLRNVRSAAR